MKVLCDLPAKGKDQIDNQPDGMCLDTGGNLYVAKSTAHDADKGLPEYENMPFLLKSKEFYLRVKVTAGAMCSFGYSIDGKAFTNVGVPFKAREGRWIGAKIGFFYDRPGKFNDAGSADIDWIHFEK